MDEATVYRVKLRVFEGPLDLLLYLIRKNQVDIYDIPIAEITQQYLDILDLMRTLNLDVAGEFLVMAATLIHIKSRTLLPVSDEGDEEEDDSADPGEDLVSRLKEYEFFKRAAETLGNCSLLGRDEFVNPVKLFEDFSDDEPHPVSRGEAAASTEVHSRTKPHAFRL